MADKLKYVTNDDTQNYPVCRLQLLFETFDTESINQSKFIKNPQSCEVNE